MDRFVLVATTATMQLPVTGDDDRMTGDLMRRRADTGSGRVTDIELFFDLVYVFAVTQLSHLLLNHPTWAGRRSHRRSARHGVGDLGLHDLGHQLARSESAAGAIDAAGADARQPGDVSGHPAGFRGSRTVDRHRVRRHAGGAKRLCRCLDVVQSLVAAQLHPDHRLVRRQWRVCARLGGLPTATPGKRGGSPLSAVDLLGGVVGFYTPGLGRSYTEEWTIEGNHIAERCQAFVLIALGESLVVTGGTLAGLSQVSAGEAAAVVCAFLGAAALWWIYFDRYAGQSTRVISQSTDPGRLGRSGYHLIHPIIVAGIIVTAAADERVLAHPTGHVEAATRWFVLGGTALFLAGPRRLHRGGLAAGVLEQGDRRRAARGARHTGVDAVGSSAGHRRDRRHGRGRGDRPSWRQTGRRLLPAGGRDAGAAVTLTVQTRCGLSSFPA